MSKAGRPRTDNPERPCKYCGAMVTRQYICSHCSKKLKLVKQILTSVKNFKAEVKGNG